MTTLCRARGLLGLRRDVVWGRARHSTFSTAAAAAPEPRTDGESLRPVSQIPGPPVYPVIGCLPTLLRERAQDGSNIHMFWKMMFDQYGPIVKFVYPGMHSTVAVWTPQDLEAVSRACQPLTNRPPLTALKAVRREMVDLFHDDNYGMFINQSEKWWRVRQKVQKPMLRPMTVHKMLHVIDQVVLDFVDRIALMQKAAGEVTDFVTQAKYLVLEGLGVLVLDRRLGGVEPSLTLRPEAERLLKLMHEMFVALSSMESGVSWWRYFPTAHYNTLHRTQKEFIEIVDQHLRDTETLLTLRTDDEEREATLLETLLLRQGLTRRDILIFIIDLFLGGIDTTSVTMFTVLYLLAKNPHVQRKLQEEVDSVLGEHLGPLTKDHLAKLSLLKAVYKEALRLYSPVLGFPRILPTQMKLRGYLLPERQRVIPVNSLTGREESVFPRALEFLPERWLRHRPLGHIHPFGSIPFGVGTRMCVGRRFAEQELYVFLTRVMQRFNVEWRHDDDLELAMNLTLQPTKPVNLTFTERR